MMPQRYIRIAGRLGFEGRVAAAILGLHLVGTVFESIGLAMLLPVFQFIQSDGDLVALTGESQVWRMLVGLYGLVGVPLNLVTLLATSFLAILSRQGFVYFRLVYTARQQENLVRNIRALAFERFLHASTAYQELQPQGEVVNDLTTEMQRAVSALFSTVTLAGYGILLLVYVGVLFVLSAPMTMAALGVILISGVAIRGLLAKTEDTGRAVTAANRGMSTFLVERLRSARLVRLSGTEAGESGMMNRLITGQRDHLVRLAALLARIEVIVEPLVVGIGFALLYLGVTAFDLRLEQIGLFLVIVLRLLPVIKEAMRTRQSVLAALGGLDAVDRRLDAMKEAAEDGGGGARFDGLDQGIRIEDLRFDYGGGVAVPALDGLSLAIPAKKMTALVGPSGGGKSTLVDMLPRLREPDGGRICIDGRPLSDFSRASLRAGIAYAPQAPQIFNVTPAQHIRYGRSEATMDEVREAARLAGADDFIRALPEGYDTPLGEGGNRLSGGQRQRLDLARALVKRAPILILDEPTSNLDAESEALFRQALSRIRRDTATTIIIIGHRLSTVTDADQIAIVNQGRVDDTGSHAELLERCEWYARAWATQTRDSTSRRMVSTA